jgi:hypothetical protein
MINGEEVNLPLNHDDDDGDQTVLRNHDASVKSTSSVVVADDVLEESTFELMDHIVSHLGNIPLCKSDSSNRYDEKHHHHQHQQHQQQHQKLAKILVLGDSHSSLFAFGKNDAIDIPSSLSDFNIKKKQQSFHYPLHQHHHQQQYDASNKEVKQCFDFNYQTCVVIGATGYGLKKFNTSKTQARKKFEKCLQKFHYHDRPNQNSSSSSSSYNKSDGGNSSSNASGGDSPIHTAESEVDYVAIMLGEVDLRKELLAKRGKTWYQQMMESSYNMFQFISHVTTTYGFRANQV